MRGKKEWDCKITKKKKKRRNNGYVMKFLNYDMKLIIRRI